MCVFVYWLASKTGVTQICHPRLPPCQLVALVQWDQLARNFQHPLTTKWRGNKKVRTATQNTPNPQNTGMTSTTGDIQQPTTIHIINAKELIAHDRRIIMENNSTNTANDEPKTTTTKPTQTHNITQLQNTSKNSSSNKDLHNRKGRSFSWGTHNKNKSKLPMPMNNKRDNREQQPCEKNTLLSNGVSVVRATGVSVSIKSWWPF